MRTIDDVIAVSPVFKDLDKPEIELIAGCGKNVVFPAGERMFKEGDPADVFYLIRHGRVALETFVANRGSINVETIEEGEIVGWSWLLPPHKWHFTGYASELVRAVQFDATCLRRKCEADPLFGYELLMRFAQILMERLQSTRLRLMDLYGDGSRS